MKRIFLLLILVCPAIVIHAQSPTDSVKAVVNKLFDGMKNADAALLKSAFADSAILQSIAVTKEGKTKIENETLDDFADFVSKQSKGDCDERIVFDVVKIDGPLAIVWTPYKFYFKGKFSHCGVDAFQLVRFNNEWKIQYIIDTRRKDKCE